MALTVQQRDQIKGAAASVGDIDNIEQWFGVAERALVNNSWDDVANAAFADGLAGITALANATPEPQVEGDSPEPNPDTGEGEPPTTGGTGQTQFDAFNAKVTAPSTIDPLNGLPETSPQWTLVTTVPRITDEGAIYQYVLPSGQIVDVIVDKESGEVHIVGDEANGITASQASQINLNNLKAAQYAALVNPDYVYNPDTNQFQIKGTDIFFDGLSEGEFQETSIPNVFIDLKTGQFVDQSGVAIQQGQLDVNQQLANQSGLNQAGTLEARMAELLSGEALTGSGQGITANTNAGSLSQGLQGLLDNRAFAAIEARANPGRFVEAEFLSRGLQAPEVQDVPVFNDTGIDPLMQAIQALLGFTPPPATDPTPIQDTAADIAAQTKDPETGDAKTANTVVEITPSGNVQISPSGTPEEPAAVVPPVVEAPAAEAPNASPVPVPPQAGPGPGSPVDPNTGGEPEEFFAHGGTTTASTLMTGDPQKAGVPNPEVISNPTNAPLSVTPTNTLSQGIPKFAYGTADATTDTNTEEPARVPFDASAYDPAVAVDRTGWIPEDYAAESAASAARREAKVAAQPIGGHYTAFSAGQAAQSQETVRYNAAREAWYAGGQVGPPPTYNQNIAAQVAAQWEIDNPEGSGRRDPLFDHTRDAASVQAELENVLSQQADAANQTGAFATDGSTSLSGNSGSNPSTSVGGGGGTLADSTTVPVHTDEQIQNMLSLLFTSGLIDEETFNQLETGFLSGEFGTQLPGPGNINVNKVSQLGTNETEVLSSLYRSASQNFLDIVMQALARAPIGGPQNALSGIQT